MDVRKAVVIGATSGIGKEITKLLSKNNYVVGIVGRRSELLSQLQQELPGKTFIKRIDVSCTEEAMRLLEELIQEMGGMDLIVISSGVLLRNPEFVWEKEKETIDVNILGFAALVGYSFRYFCKQNSGHIVGISSIAALRGSDDHPAYNASKAFELNYLEGLRKKISKLKLPITVTDIRPGLVDTPMIKGRRGFWVSSPEKAALEIIRAIEQKRKSAYITRRWRIIAWLLKLMPEWVYNKI